VHQAGFHYKESQHAQSAKHKKKQLLFSHQANNHEVCMSADAHAF
jgi:hypothetical protein